MESDPFSALGEREHFPPSTQSLPRSFRHPDLCALGTHQSEVEGLPAWVAAKEDPTFSTGTFHGHIPDRSVIESASRCQGF
jgi:hypothetical protein